MCVRASARHALPGWMQYEMSEVGEMVEDASSNNKLKDQ